MVLIGVTGGYNRFYGCFLIGYGCFLIGYGCFFIGYGCFFIGYGCFFISYGCFFIGYGCFLIGYGCFFICYGCFLMGYGFLWNFDTVTVFLNNNSPACGSEKEWFLKSVASLTMTVWLSFLRRSWCEQYVKSRWSRWVLLDVDWPRVREVKVTLSIARRRLAQSTWSQGHVEYYSTSIGPEYVKSRWSRWVLLDVDWARVREDQRHVVKSYYSTSIGPEYMKSRSRWVLLDVDWPRVHEVKVTLSITWRRLAQSTWSQGHVEYYLTSIGLEFVTPTPAQNLHAMNNIREYVLGLDSPAH